MSRKLKIANIEALPDSGSKGFRFSLNGETREMFIVCLDGGHVAYLNQCPHTGISLNWKPDEFLDLDGALIQCSTHGARFRINDGYCIYGPCIGQSLKAVRLHLTDSQINIVVDDPV